MLWDNAIHDWTTWAHAADRSPRTIWLRTYHLRRLAADMRPIGPWDVTPDHLIAWLAAPQWAAETRRSARSSLRAFYRWAALTGRLDRDPSLHLPPVRIPPAEARPVPRSVFAAAIAQAPPRTRLILQLGRFAGLRRAEIAGLHTSHLVDDCLWIVGKGRRERHVPVHPVLLGQLRAIEPGWVFPSREGDHLTPGCVGKLARRVLPPGWSLHNCRHRAGTDWYAVARDLLAVQRLLGHARPDTTQRYIQMPDDALRHAVLGVA